MSRRRWFALRKIAVLFWSLLALVITADIYSNILDIQGTGIQTNGSVSADAAPENNREEKYVAITFDDGPHSRYTPMLLEGLKARHVHATFFLIGQNIDGKEDIILQMQQDGHLIGNHSQKHMQLTAENTQAACDEIVYTNQKISAITGVTPTYIRPPYGSWSDELENMVPMTVALWNLDPKDWRSQNKDDIVRYVRSHVENGSIILLHDVYETSVEAALEIIDILSEEGYEFVTMEELLIE